MDSMCEERSSASAFIETIWRYRSENAAPFISMAEIHCSLVVTMHRDKTTVSVNGPESRATQAYGHTDTEYIGIVFKAGTFIPSFCVNAIKNRVGLDLPLVTSKSFWLSGSTWEIPSFENADIFVDWLARDGLVMKDNIVSAALREPRKDVSPRTLQRRFLQTVGLPQGTLLQIQRARYAATLLKQGCSIIDTVQRADYFDQPHLTRSLKHFIGLTPAQLADKKRDIPLSFLYKTVPYTLPYNKFVNR